MPAVSDIAFSAAVKAQQARRGSRAGYARMEEKGGWRSDVDAELAGFLAERDSFYLATANAEGQPYIQHRGGPKGFLKPLDAKTLAFADFAGNRQYISLGNLDDNPRAFIFLMDYARQTRVKIWGRAKVVEDDPELLARLADPAYPGRPERAILFEVEAWDPNCRQHIVPRYDLETVEQATEALRARIAELEAKLAAYEAAPAPSGNDRPRS